jgi:CRP/FNR family transcriptional regulator, cyclic AMP receptor protein
MPSGQRVSLLNLNEKIRTGLLTHARTIRLKRGQTLLTRGERSTQVFAVIEGRLNVVLYSASGREVSLRELAAGEIFGELAAIDGEERCANIVAVTDARVTAIRRIDFVAAIHASPEVSDWILRSLVLQVRGLTEKLFEMSALHIQARLHSELLRLARSASATGQQEISPAPTHAELANRIGTHREAVTREMRVLSERNIIRCGRRRLEFLDIAELQASVEKIGLRDFSAITVIEGQS